VTPFSCCLLFTYYSMSNNRIAKGFDLLAPVYDTLARWIIGKDIVNAQLCFLDQLHNCHRILILGGGSGWILESLCARFPHLEIDYVDVSPNMIKAAKEKFSHYKRFRFIEGTEVDIPEKNYDGVITNFYLDMFDAKNLTRVIEQIKNSLTHQATWIATDFVNEGKMHSFKLWCMYRFFRVITGIEATRLPDWAFQLNQAGLELRDSRKYNNGFIASNFYRHQHLQ
jgi:ubiquinone/menaquinone biosynthesis C-methylase UbiE